MKPDDFELFTREEVLDGLPGRHARRASALLLAIESRTAHLAAQSKQAMELFLSAEAAGERELAFLEALALGRDPPLRPTIQNLERCAPQWAPLVPKVPNLQAAVAHLLGQKYVFPSQAVPGIRAALGLDEEATQAAYQRLYHEPLETIFAPRATPADRLRWAWAAFSEWLESRPPFWTAFALTLTETVGAGILALPIALAGVGPLVGVALLLVLGLVNVLTIAYMAEAVARSGTIRYGSAFIGRVVTDYLGRAGSLILSLGLLTICFLALWAYYIGFSATLADATQVPAPAWVALLFLIGLYFLRRESLDATVASAMVIGALNISLILLLSLLAFTHLQPANLAYVNVPFLGGRPFEPAILQLIFGVVLVAYFGHLSVSNGARVVLRRDPSARALILGSMAGQGGAMALYCIWVLAVNGAIGAQELAGQPGTALAPLAARVGPGVHVLGSVFVVLGMGMASVHFSLGLFNLVREWIPTESQPIVRLPWRRGRLLLRSKRRGQPHEDLVLGLSYLGLEIDPEHSQDGSQPRFRLDIQLGGRTHRVEMAVTERWDATASLDQLLGQHDVRLALEIVDASQESVCLRVSSSLSLSYEGEWDTAGMSMADALALPDSQQELVTWMMREGIRGRETVSLADVAAHTGQAEGDVRAILRALLEQGFVRELEVGGETHYQPRLAFRRRRQLTEGIWQALEEGEEGEKKPAAEGISGTHPLRQSFILSERGRFFLSVSPVAMVFLLAEWLLLTGGESFAEPLGFLGVIVVSLLGGIFPVLLLIASRRKGEVTPGVVYGFLGQPVLLAGIYLLSLVSLFLHGLVIWEDLVQRVIALVVGGLMLGVTIALARRGTFAPRMVVELREELGGGKPAQPDGRAVFNVVVGGQPALAGVRLGYPDGERQLQAPTGEVPDSSSLSYVEFQLHATQARELKVWAHRVTPEGDSESIPARLEAYCGEEKREFDLQLSGGQAVLPLASEACRLKIQLR